MCPYQEACKEVCPANLNAGYYEACARYQLANHIGIEKVPREMKAIDYALLSHYIHCFMQ